MFQFFDKLVGFFSAIFDFIGMFISSIIQVFVLIGKGLAYVTACIAFMPPFLAVFMMAFIGISIVYLIVGR